MELFKLLILGQVSLEARSVPPVYLNSSQGGDCIRTRGRKHKAKQGISKYFSASEAKTL